MLSTTPSITPILDPSSLGSHKFGGAWLFGGDSAGIIYTCSAGFVDFGHLRDTADLTFYYFLQIQRHSASGDTFALAHYPGMVAVKVDIPPLEYPRVEPDRISIAQSLAYEEALFHEIESFWLTAPGMHNSAFSPEDLVSNFLGTYIAAIAIDRSPWLSESIFERQVTTAIDEIMSILDAGAPAVTSDALSKISGPSSPMWFNGSVMSPRYLLRRNFDHEHITPWLVNGVAGCPAGATAAPILSLHDMHVFYDATYEVPSYAISEIGASTVTTMDLRTQVAKARDRATRPVGAADPYAYGPNADVSGF